MNNLSSKETRAAILAKIAASGKMNSRDDLRAVMAAMVDKLQENYKGALKIMTPTDGPARLDMPLERWADVFVFSVLSVCERHGRTEAQVMAALDVVLAQ